MNNIRIESDDVHISNASQLLINLKDGKLSIFPNHVSICGTCTLISYRTNNQTIKHGKHGIFSFKNNIFKFYSYDK